MKKIKIMLTAVAVFAVVGAGLAFKAQKLSAQVYCERDTDGKCDDILDDFTIDENGDPLDKSFCTYPQFSQATCPATTTYELE